MVVTDQEGTPSPLTPWSTSLARVLLLCSNKESKLWQNEWKSHLCSDSMGQKCGGSCKVGQCMFGMCILYIEILWSFNALFYPESFLLLYWAVSEISVFISKAQIFTHQVLFLFLRLPVTTHTVESLNNSALQTPCQKLSETPDPLSTLCGNI